MACRNCYWSIVAISTPVFLIIFKILLKLTTGWNRSPTCLFGKTVLVTGANCGIGYYTAQDFAMRGAKVILACRNKDTAEVARKKIIEATNNPNVYVKIVDLSSLKSVREFAKDVNSTEDRLDILVNNAGVADLVESPTADGLVYTLQVNYFGPFLLTNLLINLLKKSAPSRIVHVSSNAHYFSKLDVNNLNTRHRSRNYENSKLLNILFSCELARKLEGTGVVSNSVHPGIVNTEFFNKIPFHKMVLPKFMIVNWFKTSVEGAQTVIYASVSKDLENVSGKYFDNCREAWMPGIPKEAFDAGYRKKVWETSEELVKLAAEERQI